MGPRGQGAHRFDDKHRRQLASTNDPMAPVEGRVVPPPSLRLSAKRALRRQRGAALATFVLVTGVIAPGALLAADGPLSSLGRLWIGLSLLTGGLFGLISLGESGKLWRKVEVLHELRGLAGCEVRGLSMVCRIQPPSPEVLPLTLRIRAATGNYGFELEVPWDLTADVIVSESYVYSDLWEIVEDLRAVQHSLSEEETLWSDLPGCKLESRVRPLSGNRRRPEETVESVRNRILERWRLMDRVRSDVPKGVRFRPTLLPGGAPYPPGPFTTGGWCPRCQRAFVTLDTGWPKACRQCRRPLLRVVYRYGENAGLESKMEQVYAGKLL